MYLDSLLSQALAETHLRDLQREAAQQNPTLSGRRRLLTLAKSLTPSWVGIHEHDQ
jgi:hypothetical protein